VLVYLDYIYLPSGAGDSRRKGIPSWLKDELDKMEKKRKKEAEKEEEEKMRRRDRKRPTWRDDEDSGGEEPPEIRNRDWGRRGDSSRHGMSSGLLGHLKSSSPDSVSGCGCHL